MTPRRQDAQRLRDMLDAIAKIQSWRAQNTNQWPEDMYRAAVLQELAVIGEAATHLSKHYTARHQQIPWERVRGFRNRIIHEYWDTAWARIEAILEGSLPELKAAIEPHAAPPPRPIQPGVLEEAMRRPPIGPVDAPADDRCGEWMPRARARCGLGRGHGGHHRRT